MPDRKEKSRVCAAQISQFVKLHTTIPHRLHMHATTTNGDVNVEAAADLFGSQHEQLTLCPASFKCRNDVKNGYHMQYVTAATTGHQHQLRSS